MLTIKKLKEMEPGIFKRGEGLIPQLHNKEIKWVAVRGGYHDWAIYYHLVEHSDEYVAAHGDKCFTEDIIKKLVECDDEAYQMYRR
jgi:hypothetical protein